MTGDFPGQRAAFGVTPVRDEVGGQEGERRAHAVELAMRDAAEVLEHVSSDTRLPVRLEPIRGRSKHHRAPLERYHRRELGRGTTAQIELTA